MSIEKTIFGTTKDGREVTAYKMCIRDRSDFGCGTE